MSDLQAVRSTRYSLHVRILGAVFVLVLVMYGVALAVLGLPLTERAQQNLDAGAQRELGAIMTAIQDQALLRDYPAIEQAIQARVDRFRILKVRFTSRQVAYESDTPPDPQRYPAWFAALVDIRAPQAQSDLVVGGTSYGTVSVAAGRRTRPSRACGCWRCVSPCWRSAACSASCCCCAGCCR